MDKQKKIKLRDFSNTFLSLKKERSQKTKKKFLERPRLGTKGMTSVIFWGVQSKVLCSMKTSETIFGFFT